ncbi:MAG: prepilin peptidase [Verrucomicrobiota bacterium]
MPILVGACVGSFLNVCIYRLPAGKSIVSPGSHCMSCGKFLPWFLNIPVVSWIALRGRCMCKFVKLDVRYLIVEILTAIVFVTLWHLYAPAQAIVYAVFASGLIVATFVDIDHFIIPDEVSIGGCVAGMIFSFAFPVLQGVESHWGALRSSVWGWFIGGGMLLAIAIGGAIILRKEAMGMGDIKLMAAFGAFLGWEAPIFIIAVSSVMGSVYGITLLLLKGKMFGVPMPFGPFLCLAALIWIYGGNQWMDAYLQGAGLR